MDAIATLLSAVTPLQLALLWLAVLVAAVLRSFTGFGFGLAAVPIFVLFMPPTEAVVLSSSLTFAISLISVKTYWGVYPARSLSPMLATALAGTALGVLVLDRLEIRQFQFLVGLAVIVTCLLLTRYRPRRRQPGGVVSGVVGLLSGLLNGTFAMPGPPVIVYAMATQTDPARSRSLLMTFFMFSTAMALVFYALAGFFTPATPWLFGMAFPAILAGDRLGYLLFRRFAERVYRQVALALLLLVGLATTLRALL
jgi:uncharacterized membrane protein YfcA